MPAMHDRHPAPYVGSSLRGAELLPAEAVGTVTDEPSMP